MPDCIEERITSFLEARLKELSLLGKTPTVERERLVGSINGRYPFVELCGAEVEVETLTHELEIAKLNYLVKAYFDISDDNQSANTEISRITKNVCADIKAKVKEDQSCGSLALYVQTTERGYSFDLIGDNVEFFCYVAVTVTARIDAEDSYKLG